MKVYISGPMTGYPEFNYPAFNDAAEHLRALGHEVLSPAEVDVLPGTTWETYLRADIILLVRSDAVAVLPGWEMSRGARLEVHIAHALGMTVLPIDLWKQADAA
jgi:hypothetical protein